MTPRRFKIISGVWLALVSLGLAGARAQPGPPLNVSQVAGQTTFFWTNNSSIFILQSVTNLAHPVNWTWPGMVGFFGQTNVQVNGPQNFFRLSQVTPLFQFAVFYNLDLEANPGGASYINGDVWCNGNLWTSPAGPLTFGGQVGATGQINYTRNPNDPFANGSSNNVIYTFTTNNPMPNAGPLGFAVPVSTNANRSLANFLQLMNLPPASLAPPDFEAAYSSNGLSYYYNAVDLIISNSPKGLKGTFGTNITVFYQNPNNPLNYLIPVPGDVLVYSNVTVVGPIRTTNFVTAYSWVTNASFYDYREGDTVQAVQINVAAMNTWLTNAAGTGGLQYNTLNDSGGTSKGHLINSIYVYNSVPLVSNSQLPAVRLINGAILPPHGLTVITPQPLYVWGNYNIETNATGGSSAGTTNTTYTLPAAIMADAVTVLSARWLDSYTSSTSLSTRLVGNTLTVNAAVIEGIVPSFTDAGSVKHYSGGLENYFRLLENWSGQSLWYNGSFVAMFPSQYATNYWQSPGVYYQVPTRDWGLDQNFKNFFKLPPLTPYVVNFVTP
jgi:hypothetical protein